MSMTEKEAIEWLDKDTSPMKIHIAEIKNENPMDYINSAIRVAIEAIVVAGHYRAIGTVEECRTAMERMKPKKFEPIGLFERCYCPSCLERIAQKDKFCSNCGQGLEKRNKR